MLKKRLLWQLYPSFLLVIIISVVSVAWYGAQSLRKFHIDQVAKDLKSRAYLVQEQISNKLIDEKFKEIDDLSKKIGKASSTRITVILPDGRVVADSDEIAERMKNHSNRPEIKDAVNYGSGQSIRPSETLGKRMMYVAIRVINCDKVIAVVRTSVPITAIEEALNDIYKKLFWSGLIIAVFAAVISLVISKKISRPVEQMTVTAKRFATGELNIRVALSNTAELAELAEALNEMARQLNDRIETITQERGQVKAILSSMVEGVLAVDSIGHIVSCNAAAAKLLEIDANKSVGINIEEAIRNPKIQEYIKNTISCKVNDAESIAINNSRRFLQLHGSALTQSDGASSGAVLVLFDITRTHQLEEMRRDFVANVSHELKTPITSIKGFVETLLDGEMDEPAQAKKFLQIISKHTDRLNAIIEDLLSLSRLENGSETRNLSFENTQICEPIVSAIELVKIKSEQKNIKIELCCDKEITANINAALIEQAVLNLIDNAIKYSQENSVVNISVQKQNDEIFIEFSDNGCGIKQELLDRIFERFYVVDKGRSRNSGGTGLGLSIVKHIAQVHHGRVEVESTFGRGSKFTIFLPA